MGRLQDLRARLAQKKRDLVDLRKRATASRRASGSIGYLGAAAGARVPQNKKQCAAQGGSWDASRRCCVGVSCAAPQALQPGAMVPVKNKKQCSAAGGLWTAKGKICRIPLGTLGPSPVLDDSVPDGSMPTTKPWFMPPATKPEGLICPAIRKYCRSGTTYRPNPNACFGDCLDAQGNIVGTANGPYSPPTKIPGEISCPAINIPCPPCTVALRETGGCFKDCLDAKGNVIGQGTGPDVSQVACVVGEGITGGSGVATIRPEDLLTEFGDTGGARLPAVSEQPWYTKPVLGIPVGVAVVLGAAGLYFWSKKGGGAKRVAYSRRKPQRIRRR